MSLPSPDNEPDGRGSQPHDGLMRFMLNFPGVAADELRHSLPADVLAVVDVDQVEPLPASFTEPELRTTHSDVLLRVPYRDQPNHHVYVYALVEHQSTPSPAMAERMARTILKVWEHTRTHHGMDKHQHPLVLPYVIYHGRYRWLSRTNLHDNLELAARSNELQHHDLQLQLIINDLPRYSDEELTSRPGHLYWRFLSVLFARNRDIPTLLSMLDAVAANDRRPLSDDAATAIIVYIMKIGAIQKIEDAYELLTSYPNLEHTMTTYIEESLEFLRQMATKSGLEQGRGEGLLDGRRQMLLAIIAARFGEPATSTHQRVLAGTHEDLDRWSVAVATEATIEDALR